MHGSTFNCCICKFHDLLVFLLFYMWKDFLILYFGAKINNITCLYIEVVDSWYIDFMKSKNYESFMAKECKIILCKCLLQRCY